MKLQRSILACAVIFLVGANLLSASPAATEGSPAPAIANSLAAGAPEAAASVPGFDASPLSKASPEPCFLLAGKPAFAGGDGTCGSCSLSPCAGAVLNSVCDTSGSVTKYCREFPDATCSDGKPACSCRRANP